MFISSPHLNSSLSPPYKPYTTLSHHVNCQIAIWVQRGVNPHALPTELNTVCPTGMITPLVKKVETVCFNHHTVCFMGGKEELMWSLMTTMTIFLKAETHIWVWSPLPTVRVAKRMLDYVSTESDLEILWAVLGGSVWRGCYCLISGYIKSRTKAAPINLMFILLLLFRQIPECKGMMGKYKCSKGQNDITAVKCLWLSWAEKTVLDPSCLHI